MRKFSITVNGQAYQVEVEEIGGAPVFAPAPAYAPAPVAAPAPAPAPAPAAAPRSGAGPRCRRARSGSRCCARCCARAPLPLAASRSRLRCPATSSMCASAPVRP